MAASSIIQLLPRPVLPSIWRELGGLEWAASARRDVPAPPAAGAAQPVLLIPGFLAGDSSLRPLATALRAAGHEPQGVGIRWNVGCSEDAVARVTAAAERLAERHE